MWQKIKDSAALFFDNCAECGKKFKIPHGYVKKIANLMVSGTWRRPLNVIFFTHEFFIQVGNTFIKM